MKKVSIGFVCLVLTFMLAACGGKNGEVAKSSLPLTDVSGVPAGDIQQLVEDNSTFAFNLYHQVSSTDGNLVFSPYSISLASAMIYGGAGGETESEIQQTLHFNLPADQFHHTFNALSQDINERPAQAREVDEKKPMELSITNAVWGQRDYLFEQDYLDLLASEYGAGIQLVDFINEPNDAVKKINTWVDSASKHKINQIVPPGSLDPSTRLVLVNAVYFKAAWETPFVAKLSSDAPFTLMDSSVIQVPTMKTEENIHIRYVEGDGYQALALPYKGNLAEMIILLPDTGNFTDFEQSLDEETFAAVEGDMEDAYYKVFMPKFEFTTEIDLTQQLADMGMPLAFNPDKADFSRMTQSERLYIGQAVHKAYILVNEEGTEAVAITGMFMMAASLPMEINIDRPFIFVILDKPTGTILFMGRVLNPLEN